LLDGVEARCDSRDAFRVTGEEDVFGNFAWAEVDVVLALAVGHRD
jgi:hypothetical protein